MFQNVCRMFQNVCRMFQNVCRIFQNVPECMQNVPESMQNVSECSKMYAACMQIHELACSLWRDRHKRASHSVSNIYWNCNINEYSKSTRIANNHFDLSGIAGFLGLMVWAAPDVVGTLIHTDPRHNYTQSWFSPRDPVSLAPIAALIRW